MPRRLRAEHEERMRLLRPTLQRQWAADARIAQAQQEHQAKMQAIYDSL